MATDEIKAAILADRQAIIAAIRNEQQTFLSEEYAVGQPLSSFAERFACDQIIRVIEDLKLPSSRPLSPMSGE